MDMQKIGEFKSQSNVGQNGVAVGRKIEVPVVTIWLAYMSSTHYCTKDIREYKYQTCRIKVYVIPANHNNKPSCMQK